MPVTHVNIEASAPKFPDAFLPLSVVQLPAFPVPVQARKRTRLFEKSIELKGFSSCLRPFRAWTGDAGAGAYTPAGLPNITGQLGNGEQDEGGVLGIFYENSQKGAFANAGPVRARYPEVYPIVENDRRYLADFDASRCSPIYGRSSTVLPDSVQLPVLVYLGIPA